MKVATFKEQYIKKRMLDKVIVIGIVEYSASESGDEKTFHCWNIPDSEDLPEDVNVMVVLKPIEEEDKDVDER